MMAHYIQSPREKIIENEELERIENLANEIVLSRLPVRARFMEVLL